MRCQKTHEGDIPALSRLWKQAFGDTDEEIARFFREAYPHASGFAARDGETLVGMCFALPQQLACGEDTCSAAYLYAVTTHPDFRKQGVCGKGAQKARHGLPDARSGGRGACRDV